MRVERENAQSANERLDTSEIGGILFLQKHSPVGIAVLLPAGKGKSGDRTGAR